MAKKTRATKKAVLPSSRRRAIKHPPMTTFSGSFIPSNAWHYKLGIEDGRAAIAFVVVIGILTLGLVATLLGWSKTVSDLRSEVASLRTELADAKRDLRVVASTYPFILELNRHGGSADQSLVMIEFLPLESIGSTKLTELIPSIHNAIPALRPGLSLELISVPSGSNAAFFAVKGWEAPSSRWQPLYRLDLVTKRFTALRHGTITDAVRSYASSPDGHFVALYTEDPATPELKTIRQIIVANLDRDISVPSLELVRNQNFCDFATELFEPPEISWSGPKEIRAKTCSFDRRGEFQETGFTIKFVQLP